MAGRFQHKTIRVFTRFRVYTPSCAFKFSGIIVVCPCPVHLVIGTHLMNDARREFDLRKRHQDIIEMFNFGIGYVYNTVP